MKTLVAEQIHLAYDGKAIIEALDLHIPPGRITALVVTSADLMGRTLFAPIELPCGLITAAVGAPFFLYLLRQQRRV